MMCSVIAPTARAWAVLTCFVLLSAFLLGADRTDSAPPSRTAGDRENIQAARAILEEFLQFEEREQYERCYDLFSSKYKAGLRREAGVTNGREYKRMREIRGLRWSHPKITEEVDVSSRGTAIIFTVKVTFEQPIIGERVATDRISVTVIMLRESGKWLVDAWTGSGL